jgi:hypothetical protein
MSFRSFLYENFDEASRASIGGVASLEGGL